MSAPGGLLFVSVASHGKGLEKHRFDTKSSDSMQAVTDAAFQEVVLESISLCSLTSGHRGAVRAASWLLSWTPWPQLGDGVSVVKLNTDENPASAAKYGVMSIPTLILFKEGKEIARSVGVRSQADLMEWVNDSID